MDRQTIELVEGNQEVIQKGIQSSGNRTSNPGTLESLDPFSPDVLGENSYM